MNRRDFLRAGAGSMLGAALLGCKSSSPLVDSAVPPTDAPVPFDRPPRPDRRLDQLVPGGLIFEGYRGLAALPYFDLDHNGKLICTVDDLPEVIDAHTHLGFAYGLAPKIDLSAKPDLRYLIDCDGATPPCTLDLDRYVNTCATPDMLSDMQKQIAAAFLPGGSSASKSETIPNLLDEMDRTRIKRSVVLAIKVDLLTSDDSTKLWREAILQAGAQDRLILFGSVHPGDKDAVSALAGFKALGLRGLKLHPPEQRFYADDDEAMPLYEECAKQDLPVFYHCGGSGIDPSLTAKYADIDHYLKPVVDFPKVRFIFGHAGCRFDAEKALEIARAHKNVTLEVHGQGVTWLRKLIAELGPERLISGSDWPFYPQAVQLAKVLLATEGDKRARDLILHDNPKAMLGI